LGLGVGELAGVGQLGVDGLVVVEVLDGLLVGDGDDHPVAAFLGLADVEDLDPRRRRGQGPHVFVDVGRIAQDVLGPGDVAEDLERRGDALGVGQIVDVLGDEAAVGRELEDLLGVLLVDLLLGQGRRRGQAEDQDGGQSEGQRKTVFPVHGSHGCPPASTLMSGKIPISRRPVKRRPCRLRPRAERGKRKEDPALDYGNSSLRLCSGIASSSPAPGNQFVRFPPLRGSPLHHGDLRGDVPRRFERKSRREENLFRSTLASERPLSSARPGSHTGRR
jgi:hypothetical protein